MTDSQFSFQPVIIIGAARSGTNMLRDVLTQIPGFGTWPCDEINYVWRRHNASVPHDELTRGHARPAVRRYIRLAFSRRAGREGCRCLVEKTCANSLRVGFVDAVIPEAKYVFLVRDGRDVVASAMKRWTAPLDLQYVLKKARFVPPADLPFYAARYAAHRIYRIFSPQKRLASWGPRFGGMDQRLATQTLEEVCAAQWAKCVESAAKVLGQVDPQRVIRLTYEALVQRPARELSKVLELLNVDADLAHVRDAIGRVSPQRVGNWHQVLSGDAIDRIMPILEPQLRACGYATADRASQRIAA